MIRNLFVTFVLMSMCYNADCQTLDSDNSVVSFRVRNMALNKVKGTFKGMNGVVSFDHDDVASSVFDVCIDAGTIDTGNAKRDKHLKNEDFFEVEKYPSICFKSTQITQTKSGYTATGLLSMHGVSKTIDIPFTYRNNEFIGEFKVNRFDYKLGEGTGKFLVGKEITIKIVAKLK